MTLWSLYSHDDHGACKETITPDKIEGIILAAGLSTRMGVPKLTIEIEGIPIIRRVVRAALESELHRVILVIGPSDSRAEEALGSCGERSSLESRW